MSELAVAVLRMGLLVALWVLIVSIVMAQGRDLVVGRRNKTRLEQAQRDAGLVTAVPGSAAVGRSSAQAPASSAPAASTGAPPATAPAAPAASAPVTPAPVAPTTPAPRLARTLRVVEGPLSGQTVDLDGRPLMMGRAQDADLVLVDDYASGRHARLFPQGTRWFLEDLGSTNGTYVDGDPVTRALPVGPGTAIRIGKTVMELEA
ncbi:FHA domain-containing protein FhaB/FipA [Micrococcus endophyticus]|uniref:FHA domain-containing protein FhaB/FipA n=1 Tax=Micrococcus endophyticus TaxID=455343 RepID=UPI00130DB6CE|nr:FHA domain-containing protein [Micrococcus endophyticus]MCK6091550.1 FHA domain-containing protein [Micrococcus endophyticus]